MATDVGDLYRLAFALTDPDGTPVSADSTTVAITLPDDTMDGPHAVTPLQDGQYQYDYLAGQPGRHVAHWVSTGTHPGADIAVFDVLAPTPPYLISLADAKKQLNITGDDNDDELRVFIGSATATVERIRGETVVRRSVTETLTVIRGQAMVSHLPVVSVDSVASKDGSVTWDVADLDVDDAGIITSGATPLSGSLTVIYTAG